MIQNIVILLLANTIIPMLPVPPEILAPLPLAHLAYHQISVYEHMNLSRIHQPEQFKKAFTKSLKRLHPDLGGDQQAFSNVKNLKKIIESEPRAYDTLNITSSDLEFGVKIDEAISIKETSYFVETGIFYFVILLYSISFTIDDDLRPARKYLLPLILLFGGYELFIHFHPEVVTIIDLLHNKLPIFLQKAIIKHLLSVLVAIIRTKFSRKLTLEKNLLKQLESDKKQEEEYKNILINLLKLYKDKAEKKLSDENSWGAKIRKIISTGFTILILYSIVSGFFGGSGNNGEGSEL